MAENPPALLLFSVPVVSWHSRGITLPFLSVILFTKDTVLTSTLRVLETQDPTTLFNHNLPYWSPQARSNHVGITL